MFEYKLQKEEAKSLFGKSYVEYVNWLDSSFDEVAGMLKGDGKLIKMNLSEVEVRLNNIRKILYRLQWDLHLIFPEKIHITFEEEVESDFK